MRIRPQLSSSGSLLSKTQLPSTGTRAAKLSTSGGGSTLALNAAVDAALVRFRADLSGLSTAFSDSAKRSEPILTTSFVTTPGTPAAVNGIASNRAIDLSYQGLQTTLKVNTQTSTVRSSSNALGLNLSDALSGLLSAALGLDVTSPTAASRLASSGGLGLDLTSPDAASLVRSAAALGLDLTSADAPSRLMSALALGLNLSSPEAASRLSSAGLGLDLTSPDGPSRLLSALALGLNVTSPEAASRLSSAALGLDLSSPDGPSRLLSALALPLNVSSPEAASRLSSAALGLDLTSPDGPSRLLSALALGLNVTSPEAASVLSSGGLGLDVSSPQSASTILSTAEINTATKSLSAYDLAFASSTSHAQLSGSYSGSASSLTVSITVSSTIGTSASLVSFNVKDQNNVQVGTYTGLLTANEQLDIGSTGLKVRFTAGTLAATKTATTNVVQAPTDVNTAAYFDGAWGTAPVFENFGSVTAGSFKVNGVTIAVNAHDTINAVVASINASAAGVTASVSGDKVRLATTGNSEDDIVLSNDTSGFLAATKLAGATATRGNIRDDQQTLAKTSQFSSVASGSFAINGVTIAVNRNTDTLTTLITKINAANAGVTAAFNSGTNKLVLTGTSNSEDLITVGGDTSGFLAVTVLATGNTVRGNIRDDRQMLAKTTQFASVTSGSFTINGVSIAVNRDTDTLSTISTRINGANAGVTAAYDATADKLVLTGSSNSEDLIAVAGDTSGFLSAATSPPVTPSAAISARTRSPFTTCRASRRSLPAPSSSTAGRSASPRPTRFSRSPPGSTARAPASPPPSTP